MTDLEQKINSFEIHVKNAFQTKDRRLILAYKKKGLTTPEEKRDYNKTKVIERLSKIFTEAKDINLMVDHLYKKNDIDKLLNIIKKHENTPYLRTFEHIKN